MRLGPYELLERIGVGGMAEVFRAVQRGEHGFERSVAIKRILPDLAADGDFLEMFIDEAKIAVQVMHPNVAQIYDLAREGDVYYIAQEFVQGRDMGAIVDRHKRVGQPLPIPFVLHVGVKICEALQHAHTATGGDGRPLGLIHRDVSPSNILVSFEGAVKVIDFGLAKAAGRRVSTESGVVKGKLAYLSAEQARGEEIDSRSDIFSLGTCLFEWLTGQRLFLRNSDPATVMAVQKAEVPPLRAIRSDIHPELQTIIMNALQSDPNRRYQRAADLQEALHAFSYRARMPLRRRDAAQYMQSVFPEIVAQIREKARAESMRAPPQPKRTLSKPVPHGPSGPPRSEAASRPAPPAPAPTNRPRPRPMDSESPIAIEDLAELEDSPPAPRPTFSPPGRPPSHAPIQRHNQGTMPLMKSAPARRVPMQPSQPPLRQSAAPKLEFEAETTNHFEAAEPKAGSGVRPEVAGAEFGDFDFDDQTVMFSRDRGDISAMLESLEQPPAEEEDDVDSTRALRRSPELLAPPTGAAPFTPEPEPPTGEFTTSPPVEPKPSNSFASTWSAREKSAEEPVRKGNGLQTTPSAVPFEDPVNTLMSPSAQTDDFEDRTMSVPQEAVRLALQMAEEIRAERDAPEELFFLEEEEDTALPRSQSSLAPVPIVEDSEAPLDDLRLPPDSAPFEEDLHTIAMAPGEDWAAFLRAAESKVEEPEESDSQFSVSPFEESNLDAFPPAADLAPVESFASAFEQGGATSAGAEVVFNDATSDGSEAIFDDATPIRSEIPPEISAQLRAGLEEAIQSGTGAGIVTPEFEDATGPVQEPSVLTSFEPPAKTPLPPEPTPVTSVEIDSESESEIERRLFEMMSEPPPEDEPQDSLDGQLDSIFGGFDGEDTNPDHQG